MNYYDEIKNKIIDNEVYVKVKDYSKGRYKLKTYIEIGELLYNANSQYGDKIIKEYSQRLSADLNKKYSVRYLFDIRKLYLFIKVHPLGSQLTISHCRLLFRLNNNDEIDYYINQVISNSNTIGILICKKENKFVIEYCSDDRIVVREYELVWYNCKYKRKTNSNLLNGGYTWKVN